MKNQLLLDELIGMNEAQRLQTIRNNADYLLGEEFLTFMRGQIEFAESLNNGAGYFDRVYIGENTSFLKFMEQEMKQHGKQVQVVWKSMEKVIEHLDEKLMLETGIAHIFATGVNEMSEETTPCYKCKELVKSHGLCNGCLHCGPVKGVSSEDSCDTHLATDEIPLWLRADIPNMLKGFLS